MTVFAGQVVSLAPAALSLAVLSVFGMAQGVLAADECGAEAAGADTITCAAGNYLGGGTYPNYPAGITYTNSDGLTLILNDPALSVPAIGVTVTSSGTAPGSTSLQFDAGSISTAAAGKVGLRAVNAGQGNNSVVMNGGTVKTTGAAGEGIFSLISNASSTGAATGMLTAGSISTSSGNARGIHVRNSGLGAATAQMTGGSIKTGSTNGVGLFSWASNATSTADATSVMSGGTITVGGYKAYGVHSVNSGMGASSSIMNGGTIQSSGRNAHGLYATILNGNSTATTTALMTAGVINATNRGGQGVVSQNGGLGDAVAQVDGGSVTTGGIGAHALFAWVKNGASSADAIARMNGGTLTVNGGTNAQGIQVINSGSGLAQVVVSGNSTVTATGPDSNGIRMRVGQKYAISVGGTSTVTGGSTTGAGIRIHSVAGGSGTVDIAAGATVDGTTYGTRGIIDDAGDTTVNVAGTLSGDVILGDGSDSLTIAGTADISGVTLLDGGDDAGSGDGFSDTLTLMGQTMNVPSTFLANWENIAVDGGRLAISDGALTFGGGSTTGLSVRNAGVFDAGTSFALTGNLFTAANGTFQGAGSGSGTFSISGNVVNDGAISSADGGVGDVITVGGNYSGSGEFHLDVDTGTDRADTLVVNGNAAGSSTGLVLNNLASAPATGNDILVVSVNGATAPGDFVLRGGALSAGAFDYDLSLKGNKYYLVGTQNINGSVYAALPVVLNVASSLPSFKRRWSNRLSFNSAGSRPAVNRMQWGDHNSFDVGDLWMRLNTDRQKFTMSDNSRVSARFWGFQVGKDFVRPPSRNGQWILGLTGQYNTASSTITDVGKSGTLNSRSAGIGATASWLGNNGLYLDTQTQLNWATSSAATGSAGSLVAGQGSTVFSASLEVGKRFRVNGGRAALVPQAQLMYQQAKGTSFQDSHGNTVNLVPNASSSVRLGVAYEFAPRTERDFYLIGNLLYDVAQSGAVSVNGLNVNATRASSLWGEVGLGGTVRLNENSVFFGEALYRRPLGGGTATGQDTGLNMTLGMRFAW